jgi:hypothetical protein
MKTITLNINDKKIFPAWFKLICFGCGKKYELHEVWDRTELYNNKEVVSYCVNCWSKNKNTYESDRCNIKD